MWKLHEIQSLVSINEYALDTATLVYLCVVHYCFHATTAELSSWNRDHMAHKVQLLSGPLQERKRASLPTLPGSGLFTPWVQRPYFVHF